MCQVSGANQRCCFFTVIGQLIVDVIGRDSASQTIGQRPSQPNRQTPFGQAKIFLKSFRDNSALP